MRICLAISACLLALAAPATAAKPAPRQAPPPVEIKRVGMTAPVAGRAELLVAVRYPIQLAGQPLELAVSLRQPARGRTFAWNVGAQANAGRVAAPERRRAFTFVHRIGLSGDETRQALRRPTVVVDASGFLDIDRDSIADLDSRDREAHRLSVPGAAPRLCGSVPQLSARPGGTVATALPSCGARVRWRIASRPGAGRAQIRDGKIVYRPTRRFRGTVTLELAGTPRQGPSKGNGPDKGAKASSFARAKPLAAPVQVQVLSAAAEGAVVRAIGDSVTAGFGYYDNGESMPFVELLNCRPGEGEYDDACSSNSAVRTNAKGTKLEYAPDYGLANNVSWAAQWANAHAVENYANFAVSGSEPKDWAPGGQLYATTKRVESESPDYILITVGANPLLSDVLFGTGNMECAIWSDIVGGFSECVEKAFEGVELRASLAKLYRELVAKTDAVVYLMQYPLTVPSSAIAYSSTQIAQMGALLNREIASVAAEVNRARLRPISPPHFNVGIDVSPVYPSKFTCSYLEYPVDGPSVQSEPTQDELEIDHPLSFCEGPAGGGPAWVIDGDTGIHPSATGYAQMASQVPAP